MHTIYLGYSTAHGPDEMVLLFDIDFDREGTLSKFAQIFGCGYIEPGSFEIYGREDYPSLDFDRDLLTRLLPFEPDPDIVAQIDFGKARSVFYVSIDRLERTEGGDIKVFGPMRIERFNYEQP